MMGVNTSRKRITRVGFFACSGSVDNSKRNLTSPECVLEKWGDHSSGTNVTLEG